MCYAQVPAQAVRERSGRDAAAAAVAQFKSERDGPAVPLALAQLPVRPFGCGWCAAQPQEEVAGRRGSAAAAAAPPPPAACFLCVRTAPQARRLLSSTSVSRRTRSAPLSTGVCLSKRALLLL